MSGSLVHQPAMWAGALLHLTVTAVALALAVVFGPALAWLVGIGGASLVVTVLAVIGRALAGFLNAGWLWRQRASMGLCLRTVAGAVLLGHTAVFGLLGAAGAWTGGALPAGELALLPSAVDAALALLAACAGALIAAAPPNRRRPGRRRARRWRRRIGPGSGAWSL